MARSRSLTIDHRRERARWGAPSTPDPRRARRGATPPSPLKPVDPFGPNPGALTMWAHAPRGLGRGAPLVVVLHGCGQDARGYDAASGWSRLADELGFALVFPEQKISNNPGGCFNWFLPADAARGLGETRSIREMVEHMVERHAIDPARVFVTGLSAGGAMTAALLADYPETFSAGAVIAGLPCGAATSVREALGAMSDPKEQSADALGDAVRTASPHLGPWPRVMVLHGDRDETVALKNADALVEQWVDVHGADRSVFEERAADGLRFRVWSKDGRTVVEQIIVAGMGHGAPLDGALGERKAPFMLDVGLSSTRRIADFFGIPGALDARPASRATAKAAERQSDPAARETPRTDARLRAYPWPWRSLGAVDVARAINKALKRAGMIR